ncbi:signal peptide and 4 transmembrane domain protein [Cryptosporidium ryanae]|uniref:signal peptide and 4 transmembrane domain protein n=1 Tax=Cryptosporidium ryanae TaxID=515981 RepID=UPI00351A1790|nr:signal peptide and 4 transmembrane domain protein [Cryptosporidium ryanae]
MRNIAKPFWMSLSSIFLSELGDKTFFISAILSMSNSPWIVFGGSMFALTTMTLFACLIGYIIPSLFTPKYTHYLSCVLFLIFGIRGLYEGIFFMKSGDANSEFLEVKAELDKSRKKGSSSTAENKMDMLDSGNTLISDVELCESNCNQSDTKNGDGISIKNYCNRRKGVLELFRNKSFIQSFTLTALAEWGDRSQITTILLSSYYYPPPVFFGSVLGHFVCTGLACYAGKYLSKFISPRMVTLSGGILFLAFALFGIIVGPE